VLGNDELALSLVMTVGMVIALGAVLAARVRPAETVAVPGAAVPEPA
jgi:hypothetical protein